MKKLTDYSSYADAQANWSPDALWDLFDGNKQQLNIAHECIDRHATAADGENVAVTVVHAAGGDELITFRSISEGSSRFAHYLTANGVTAGDRVAIMLEPSRAFYIALFGVIKMGAIAVPMFTLFGPDALRLRIQDCRPSLLVTNKEKASSSNFSSDVNTLVMDDEFINGLSQFPDTFTTNTSASDMAIFQYTSGTTRELPEAVKHTHKAIVTLMVAALYGTGLRPGDKFFCPSSPAWGHGLWHGTLAPLAMGLSIGTFSGRFNADRLLAALATHRFTNMSAAATHYRMMRNSPDFEKYDYAFNKLSFTGEPIDSSTEADVERVFKTDICSMYGTTEIGVVLVSYPGARDFAVKKGSLGKPIPGARLEVQNPEGTPCAPNETGEMKVWRQGEWIATKDLGRIDGDGYFYHGGRADDVIISAGWTMSAVEIEDTLLKHPDVLEAAAIGVPDALRGQVVKAFIVSSREADADFSKEIQEFVRKQLSQHEYPRHVVFVADLPKTPAGKIHRKKLRESEAALAEQAREHITQ